MFTRLISALSLHTLNSTVVKRFKQHQLNKNTHTKNVLPPVELNLFHVINDEITLIKQQFSERKIILQNIKNLPVNHSQPTLFTIAFTTAFSQILRNACMYTDDNTPIIVIGERKGAHVFISVLDYGQGLPETDIEKILTPDTASQHSHDSVINGKLKTQGLIIAKHAIESIGGSIAMKNHTNVGLLVTLGLST